LLLLLSDCFQRLALLIADVTRVLCHLPDPFRVVPRRLRRHDEAEAGGEQLGHAGRPDVLFCRSGFLLGILTVVIGA
jgi:hypothetical protein